MPGIINEPSPGGGGQIASDVVGGLANVASTILTNQANKRENEATRAYNLKMWQMQNEYNTPAAQMSRYIAAGLNPNLIYGSGAGSSGNASSPSPASPVNYRAPSIDVPNIIGILNAVRQNQILAQQEEKLKWQTGEEKEKYKAATLTNNILFNDNSYVTPSPYDRSSFQWVKAVAPGISSGPSLKQRLFESQYGSQAALAQLRNQEVNMNSVLKPYGVTSKDPLLIRVLMSNFPAILKSLGLR